MTVEQKELAFNKLKVFVELAASGEFKGKDSSYIIYLADRLLVELGIWEEQS